MIDEGVVAAYLFAAFQLGMVEGLVFSVFELIQQFGARVVLGVGFAHDLVEGVAMFAIRAV